MKIADLIAAVEAFAPPALQEEWDNAGLLAGEASLPCTGVLCTLDMTVAVVEEAVRRNCNLIIAHHPIIFKGLKSLTGKNYVEQVVIKALTSGVALYAAHTNLDNVIAGVNGRIAEKLRLQQPAVLQPKTGSLRRLISFAPVAEAEHIRQALFGAGAGHIGNYSECSFNSVGTGTFKPEPGASPATGEIGRREYAAEAKIEVIFPFYLERQIIAALKEAHSYEEVAYDVFTLHNPHQGTGSGIIGKLEEPLSEQSLLEDLKKIFGPGCIRHTAFTGRPVRKVAVCGGAGSFLTKAAIAQGADAYITADVKYHEFFDAEGRLLLADIGHFESEQFTVGLLADILREKFPTFAVLKSEVNTNPVHYFV